VSQTRQAERPLTPIPRRDGFGIGECQCSQSLIEPASDLRGDLFLDQVHYLLAEFHSSFGKRNLLAKKDGLGVQESDVGGQASLCDCDLRVDARGIAECFFNLQLCIRTDEPSWRCDSI
jgi:hypothetical protein